MHKCPKRSTDELISFAIMSLDPESSTATHGYQCDRAQLWDDDNQQLSFLIGAESITKDSRSTLNLCHRKLKSLALWSSLPPTPQHTTTKARDLNLVQSCGEWSSHTLKQVTACLFKTNFTKWAYSYGATSTIREISKEKNSASVQSTDLMKTNG